MDRSQSTCFQQVEDWLRGLGLLLYAQSFYDNGYEDIDTCKEINYEDLDVIGVKSERDREDIIAAVQKLKQNVYFVLEEATEKLELIKLEPIILKSKLKELLTTKNVQLVQPPYYFPDGTLGDLYPLAITLADELCTHFNDVLDGLEQLRKRQLPSKTYDEMNEGSEDDKARSSAANDPPEYLNCEMNAMNRVYSISKYDTRVTKSTTDLTKDICHERSASAPHSQKFKVHKGKPEDGKGKSRFGSIFRKDTIKSNKGSVKDPYFDFKANEISLSQTELCSMMSKVKNNEMSQDEVLAAVKMLSLSGEGKQSPNTTLERTHEHSASLNKSKKNKISKQMIKRTPSATFYTSKDDSTPYMIPAPENASLERTRSGSSIGGDDQHSDKSSPEVGKTGIISKIRSSMRKKGKHDSDESNLSQSGSISSQENITLSDASASPEMKKHDPPTTVSPQAPPIKPSKPLSPNVHQQPIPVVPIKKPTPPLKPLKKPSGEFEEFSDDRDPSLQVDKPPPHCTKIENSNKIEGVKRLSNRSLSVEHVEDGVAPGRGLILDISKAKLKPVPKAPPRLPKVGSPIQEDESRPTTPSTPVAPPRLKREISVPSTPIETTSIDDIGRKMDNLIAGLDTRLNDIEDNYVDDSQLNEFTKIPPVKPAVMNKPQLPSRRPVMPPKRIEPNTNPEEKPSVISNELVNDTISKNEIKPSTFTPLPLKRILWKKLRAEGIPIHETPYTKDGEWNVPRKLVTRYAEELGKLEDEVIKVLDEIRQDECNKVKLPFVEYRQKDLDSHELPKEYSLDHWLVYNGLPMFAADLKEVKVTTIQQINELTNNDFKSIGVYQEKHVHYLKMAASKEVGGDSIVFC